MNIYFGSAKEIARYIEKKEISSYEVVEAFVSKIDKVNPKVNAIFSLQVEKALEQAKRLDNKISKGEKIGALLPQINTLMVTDFI
jgi:Asp-tRNA(Asn)/Glu-tRNA(Gln) amidotransferase A subunit family amidase